MQNNFKEQEGGSKRDNEHLHQGQPLWELDQFSTIGKMHKEIFA